MADSGSAVLFTMLFPHMNADSTGSGGLRLFREDFQRSFLRLDLDFIRSGYKRASIVAHKPLEGQSRMASIICSSERQRTSAKRAKASLIFDREGYSPDFFAPVCALTTGSNLHSAG
jgi:hypothetical protein